MISSQFPKEQWPRSRWFDVSEAPSVSGWYETVRDINDPYEASKLAYFNKAIDCWSGDFSFRSWRGLAQNQTEPMDMDPDQNPPIEAVMVLGVCV